MILKQGDLLIEKYQIVKVIAERERSRVYLAKSTSADEYYAIKEMCGERLPEEEKSVALETFEKEIKVLRTLRHPGIPQFFENFREGMWYYLVMEYIEGNTLEEIVKEQKKPIEVMEALSWAIEICYILHFLHHRAKPIIFRNLSPSNIMLSKEKKIKLIDFGLARYFDEVKDRDTHVLGTFGFAAPEQYGKSQSTPCTDIYSFGATFYYLLTLKNVQEFLFNFPPIRKFNPNVSKGFEKILAQCLEKDPKKRFRSAISLKKELEKEYQHLYKKQSIYIFSFKDTTR